MKTTGELRDWLLWVIKIRFVIISFVFAVEYAIRTLGGNPGDLVSLRYFGMIVILWYVLSLFYLIYYQLSRDYALQAYLQIFSDIVIITAILHVTGDLESNYLSLYLVAIILASVLFPRGRAFLVAGVCFVFMGAVLELAYLPSLYSRFAAEHPAMRFLATSSLLPVDLRRLQIKIGASFFGFFAVAYLASYLAENLRKAGAELRDKSGQVASLQAIKENIIQSVRNGLLTTDLDGTIRDLNPAGAAILGWQFEALRGKRVASVLGDLGVEGPSPPQPASLPWRQEIVYEHPGLGPRILGVSVSPLEVPEVGVAGYVYNFQDLTEEKRREAEYHAKDRMATLGRMAAGIAHEIRNPLASIAGSVKVLRSLARLDEDQAKLIEIVSQESERLNKLVSDYLLYDHEQALDFHPVDLVNLLEETLLLVEHHPLFNGEIRVERRFPDHAVVIAADGNKLRQVFWNISDNSLKAMPEGGTLSVEVEEVGSRLVRVTLGDTGVGFAAPQLEKLFEPFQSGFRAGTGLGLAIVDQIIRGHGGAIQVDSRQGEGARFRIELPRKPLRASPDSARARRTPALPR
jgi:two-component system, NtrC family, sensor histidine kinase PilS